MYKSFLRRKEKSVLQALQVDIISVMYKIFTGHFSNIENIFSQEAKTVHPVSIMHVLIFGLHIIIDINLLKDVNNQVRK